MTTSLEVHDQDELVRDLRQIDRMVGSGLDIQPEPSYPVGTRVRIQSGPLKGLVGTVIRRDGQDRFAATVNYISRGATVELRDWEVEPED